MGEMAGRSGVFEAVGDQPPRITCTDTEITGYEAVKAAARDWEVYSSEFQAEQDVRAYRQYPLESDPPTHGEYRAILTPLFDRRRIAELEPQIRAIADELIANFASAGHADAVHQLALPMVLRSLGVALGRPQDVDEWLTWGLNVFERDGRRDGRHLDAYLERVFDEVQRQPGEDVFSHIAGAQFQGRRLTRIEMLGFGNLVLAGGRETVVNLICSAIWRLGSWPEERRQLATNPALIPVALDELLRYLSPLPWMERKLTKDVGEFPSGSQVALSFLSANHDPSAFSDPGTLDLARRPNHHLAFGNGPHTCIGVHLGRLEARVFLEVLLAAVPDFELTVGTAIAWQRAGNVEVPKDFLFLPVAVVR